MVSNLQTSSNEHIVNEFKLWKSLYSKKYTSEDHEFFRMRIFEENYAMI